jgi:hypothetical protein
MWNFGPLGALATDGLLVTIVPLESGAALLVSELHSDTDHRGMSKAPTSSSAPVSHIDAEDFAARFGMRLPTLSELQFLASCGAIECKRWEWTSTPSRKGWVVFGGAYRNRQHSSPSAENVSWEKDARSDVSFRCVRTLPPVHGGPCPFCGGTGRALVDNATAITGLDETVFCEGMPVECPCGAAGVAAINAWDMSDAVGELLFDALSLQPADISTATNTRRSLRDMKFESSLSGNTLWVRRRGELANI